MHYDKVSCYQLVEMKSFYTYLQALDSGEPGGV